MKNIPKVIYLNFEERGEDFKDHAEITWSEERINDSDIRFVLSDNSVIHSVSGCFPLEKGIEICQRWEQYLHHNEEDVGHIPTQEKVVREALNQ